MPVSRLSKALPVKVARRTMGLFGRALRPLAADRDAADEPPVVELLLATGADEAPAERASRQARIYLERRRRRLNEQLHAER